MQAQEAINLKWMKKLTADNEMVPRSLLWATTPFVAHGYVVATDGCSLVALKDMGNSGWTDNPHGEKAIKTLMSKPLGDEPFPLRPFVDWLREMNRPCTDCGGVHKCNRTDEDGYECCFVFDSFVDRSLLFRFLRNIEAETFTFRAEESPDGQGHMLIFGGPDWRVIAMGLKRRAIEADREYPRYPATAKRPRTKPTIG